jgi:3-phenylpropionate/trans-cinnamate dioxygenase ferredoxin reductase subunit
VSASRTVPDRRGARPSHGTFVIVGAGQSGAQAAFTLREHGFAGRIVLIGDEPQAPYERPPLSKKFLSAGVSVDRLFLRPPAFYADNGIELLLHTCVDGLDRQRQRVCVGPRRWIEYDVLLLATGSRPRRLDIPGAKNADVHYLHTLQDALNLRGKLAAGLAVAVIGGGYVGLEAAATARACGARVFVHEAQDRILKRVTTPIISDYFSDLHRGQGVEISCGTQVTAIESGERVYGLSIDGTRIPADLVVVGIGAVPNIELAKDAGLACSDGITVDEHCRTSDPNIFAAGDCTNHPNPHLRARIRLESVQNAVDQGTAAALNMMGMTQAYCEVPWFWSHQYDAKLQSAGSCHDHDQVEHRGNAETGRFALVYRKEGQIVGIDAVNLPRDYMQCRKAIEERYRGLQTSKRLSPSPSLHAA